jgi:hypothetical protein
VSLRLSEIIQAATADGVTLALSPTGTVKVRGRPDALDRWLPALRAHKPEVAALLSDLAEIDRWLDRIEERDPAIREHVLRQCRTDAGAMAYFLRHARGEFLH